MITQTKEGRVLHIALNRPEKRNALNVATCRDLVNAFDQADADNSVGAVVLSGNGPSFCAGMDLRESVDTDLAQLGGIHERLYSTILRIRKPIISAVHGAALAGGTGLVANTHIVVARPDARFGLTEVRIGLWPVLIFRAMEIAIGERRMVELSLTGREFSATEAMEYGLVTEITADPAQRAFELARRISSFSPRAVGTGLDYVHSIRGHNWDHASKVGRILREQLLTGDDYREGVQAFTEKRAPVWPSLKE
jgi:enoyl-CoA hydratase/carnithine racemase